jgi:membrane associated rhomboid family serine protease
MNPAEQPDSSDDAQRLRQALWISVAFAAVLWVVKIWELLLGLELGEFGVYPRRLSGLAGVLAAPFIHGSLAHLVSNTLPIIILGTALLYGYPKAARIALPVFFLGTGLGVWLFAREAYHIGASGLTFGMMFFVFTIGVVRWDRRAIALSLIVFFLYGGMVWGVFPGDPGISYESHLFGALLGVTLAVLLRRLDPERAPRRYSWEDEANDPQTEDEADLPQTEDEARDAQSRHLTRIVHEDAPEDDEGRAP